MGRKDQSTVIKESKKIGVMRIDQNNSTGRLQVIKFWVKEEIKYIFLKDSENNSWGDFKNLNSILF